ncbi:PQ-loop domain-containing transporter [Vaginisenegalia massiliensis]|uniref:PQ-loop domain-containing transporter n=1 Tax=Vaginisenegalia massiliensis TaxID=2058294 RepID=UPI000F523D38|nr:PQ-loop domain-containing transporter [Vaginisenegalia massiliensis]
MKKFSLTIAPLIAGIAITICYLPQLWLTFTTHNVEGQSVGFWVLLCIALLGLVIQQIGLVVYVGNRNYIGLFTEMVNLVFALAMLIMVVMFK